MAVYWHNRIGLAAPQPGDEGPTPIVGAGASLGPLVSLVIAAAD
jgi:hypothetical protein